MDIATISQLISTIGFPIAACIALYLMDTKQISKLTEIIENNTRTMEELQKTVAELLTEKEV